MISLLPVTVSEHFHFRVFGEMESECQGVINKFYFILEIKLIVTFLLQLIILSK